MRCSEKSELGLSGLEHSERQALQCDLLFALDPFGFKLVFITAKGLSPLPSPLHSKSNLADISSASPGETILLMSPAGFGFTSPAFGALTQVLWAEYTSSAVTCGHSKGDLMVAGKGEVHPCILGNARALLGTEEICSCKDDCLTPKK